MSNTRTIVSVFLASPSDLADERRAAKVIIDEINGSFANNLGYQVELVGWEDTVSVFGRPQSIINAELDRCELFVGMLWKKWGTPPDKSGKYTSGFEEEFSRCVKRHKREGRPEISLFFKDVDPEVLQDPGVELKKVLDFKRDLIARKVVLFQNFSVGRDFEAKIRFCVSQYIMRLWAAENTGASEQAQILPADEPTDSAAQSGTASKTPLTVEGANFLREFIREAEDSSDSQQLRAIEIARFRLLGTIISRSGNDEPSLGVHDANLLFNGNDEFVFAYAELSGLLTCGLQNYARENVPLWRWYAEMDGFKNGLLFLYTIGGYSTDVGAISAARLIAEPLPTEPPIDRAYFLRVWLRADADSDVRVAALRYLADLGVMADLPTIKEELDRGHTQTTNAAIDAMIRIVLRNSRTMAIAQLYELQPAHVAADLLDALFESNESLQIALLLRGLDHRNAEIRRITARLLRLRRALREETADQLTSDNDAGVRFEALQALIDAGRKVSEEEAKKVLVRPVRGTLLGFGSAPSLDTIGEGYWKQFREERLKSLNDRELEEAAKEPSIYDRDAYFVLADRHFKKYAPELRALVDDKFKAEFDRSIASMSERFSRLGLADLVDKTRDLEEYLRKGLTRRALDIICRKQEAVDLGRVRTALREGFIGYSAEDIMYLRRHGEWEDIPLIITAAQRIDVGRNPLLFIGATDYSKFRLAARVIYAMARDRFSELVLITMPARLLVSLLDEASEKVFRAVSDASIDTLLRSDELDVRKATALKCIRALPRTRIIKILRYYISREERHYYNIVHWLDLGVAAPRDRAIAAAKKAMDLAFGAAA